MSESFNSDFSYNEVWLTDKNSTSLEIEHNMQITLVFNQSLTYKRLCGIRDLCLCQISDILTMAGFCSGTQNIIIGIFPNMAILCII